MRRYSCLVIGILLALLVLLLWLTCRVTFPLSPDSGLALNVILRSEVTNPPQADGVGLGSQELGPTTADPSSFPGRIQGDLWEDPFEARPQRRVGHPYGGRIWRVASRYRHHRQVGPDWGGSGRSRTASTWPIKARKAPSSRGHSIQVGFAR